MSLPINLSRARAATDIAGVIADAAAAAVVAVAAAAPVTIKIRYKKCKRMAIKCFCEQCSERAGKVD